MLTICWEKKWHKGKKKTLKVYSWQLYYIVLTFVFLSISIEVTSCEFELSIVSFVFGVYPATFPIIWRGKRRLFLQIYDTEYIEPAQQRPTSRLLHVHFNLTNKTNVSDWLMSHNWIIRNLATVKGIVWIITFASMGALLKRASVSGHQKGNWKYVHFFDESRYWHFQIGYNVPNVTFKTCKIQKRSVQHRIKNWRFR